ncbi:MAG: hypothetical protein NZ927_09455, partial [Candidatus Calescibacterium sp.]|nr:hypothetical protein [Candidatus Calescibacterium sp.]
MKRYDVSLKELILGAEKELLKFAGLDVSKLEAINVELPTVKEKRVDVAYRCWLNSGISIIVQAEFQLYY